MYVSVCSATLGQNLHYGGHDFFPPKHVSPFYKSASSNHRQVAVGPTVCRSVCVGVYVYASVHEVFSVCVCLIVCTLYVFMYAYIARERARASEKNRSSARENRERKR